MDFLDSSRVTWQRARRDLHGELMRSLGLVMRRTRLSVAARDPFFNGLLHRAGVLARAVTSWDDEALLEPMPWGSGRYPAPPAKPPAGYEGVWPQAPVVNPGFCAPVLHLPPEERRQHQRYIVLRYVGQATALLPEAALRAVRGPRLLPLDDRRFGWILSQTSLAQFLCPTLDPADHRIFAPVLRERGGDVRGLVKLDASAVDGRHALPGVYVAPTITLLEPHDAGGFRPLAIQLGETLVRPADGAAWELARYFVLQGAQYLLVLLFHPLVHFPGDAINAVTRTLLPRDHLLRRLLEPHLDFTLGLHEAVIHHRRSVLHNSQRELFTPFPLSASGIHDGIATGLRGVEGNSAYPPFRFGPHLPGAHTLYGRYRRDWYGALLDFVARVTRNIPREDPVVTRWAEHIHTWLPSFPSGAEIHRGEALAEAVTSYLSAITVFHTADHHSYAGIPLAEMPWRLRRPPEVRGLTRLALDELVSSEDFLRHQLCHAMFFKPFLLRSLREVSYRFAPGALFDAARDFTAAMQALDDRWRGSTFPSSQEIACSLQY